MSYIPWWQRKDEEAAWVEKMTTPLNYGEWCAKYKCSHGHCPRGCEHPQPFVEEETAYCGACYFRDRVGRFVPIIPCRKGENCE